MSVDSKTEISHVTHPCPACGYYVFSTLDDQGEICPICGWQNDMVDLQEMYRPMGPNKVSLEEAQKNFIKIGVSDQRFVTEEKFLKSNFVRKPTVMDHRDPKWRPLDRAKDQPRKIDNSPTTAITDQYYWYWN